MGLYWHLKAVKRALGPLIFRLEKHEISSSSFKVLLGTNPITVYIQQF